MKLRVRAVDHKCLDSSGEWDRTYDTSYEWVIENDEGVEIDGMDGYPNYDKAFDAGLLALKRKEE